MGVCLFIYCSTYFTLKELRSKFCLISEIVPSINCAEDIKYSHLYRKTQSHSKYSKFDNVKINKKQCSVNNNKDTRISQLVY